MSKIEEKSKGMCDSRVDTPRILIYDDNNLNYIVGNIGMIRIEDDEHIDVSSITDCVKHYIPSMTRTFICNISNFERLNNIELDETTMKRIAKYNKETDIKKLDKKIKEKEEKIKELDDVLKDKNGRVKKLQEFVANLYDIDITDDDYDDYDD